MSTAIGILMAVCFLIIFGILEYVISLKKKIYRTYVDPFSSTANRRSNKYDGYWFAEDIGLDGLMEQNPEDEWLQKSGRNVKRCQIIFFCIFAFMMGIAITGKIYGWI